MRWMFRGLRQAPAATAKPLSGRISAAERQASKRTPNPSAARAACPHCSVILEPPPTRSRKCPECRQPIARRNAYETGQILFLTPEDAQTFDAERETRSAREEQIRRTKMTGASQTEFEDAERELERRWGNRPAPGDVFWTVSAGRLADAFRRGDWRDAHWIEFTRARYLFENGREHIQALRQANEYDLRAYAESGFRTFEAFAAGCCTACGEATKAGPKYLTLDEAIQGEVLPHAQCTYHAEGREAGWCTCRWMPALRDA